MALTEPEPEPEPAPPFELQALGTLQNPARS
jgi:hypothetical protein